MRWMNLGGEDDEEVFPVEIVGEEVIEGANVKWLQNQTLLFGSNASNAIVNRQCCQESLEAIFILQRQDINMP